MEEFMPAKDLVIGTVRDPDGEKSGSIDGLVLETGNVIIRLPEAIRRAEQGQLESKVPGDGRRVDVVAVDENGDGRKDAVRTAPDKTRKNNLLDLPIWNRVRREWIYL
jgi:hypothetical protein